MKSTGMSAWVVCVAVLALAGCAGGTGRSEGRAGDPEIGGASDSAPKTEEKRAKDVPTPEAAPAERTARAAETKPAEKPAEGHPKEKAGKTPTPSGEAFEILKKKAGDRPVVCVRRIEKGPEVDGKIDDIYDKFGAVLELKMNDGSRRLPSDKTSAWILADAENLYIAVRANAKDPDKIVANKKNRDDDVWEDETVEIFLDPEDTRESRYFHIIVNAAGTIQDARDRDDTTWNPKIEVKCGKEPGKAWVAELKIPFSELGVKPGKTNKIWSLNVTRTARDPEDPATVEDTAWSPTESRSPHVPEKFGYMFLEQGDILNMPK